MFSKIRTLALIATITVSSAVFTNSWAQELSEAHLDAARVAVEVTKATESFDSILLEASSTLKNQLTANNPDKAEQINTAVDEEAIALASRRGDLENEAVRLFANSFTEAELKEIGTFFGSEVGKKYLDSTPILARELSKAARIWANGVNRDLQENVQKKMAAPAN